MSLLLVRHSRSGQVASLVAAVEAGVGAAQGAVVSLSAFDAAAEDVINAGGVILATPANFGYMSGALKDFFERIYHPCLPATVGKPYALVVKGDTDTSGAIESVERIVAGLRWKRVLPVLSVVGAIGADDLTAASELGAALAAGLDAGIF